jgi:hypothetical protein
VTRRPLAPRTDGGSPGIRGGHRQACGHDPSARAWTQQRADRRHSAVGQHLPGIAARALGAQAAARIRAHPGYDTASYKESEERCPTR